jgi:membrane fusion protein, macrolide-specific efflux system
MRNIKFKIILVVVIISTVTGVVIFKIKGKSANNEITKEINPTVGSLKTYVSTTGTVLPQNRLEVKPPVGVRVDSVEVQEGDKVKIGQILAWMSSTERAALLDAARGQGEASLKYWKEVYKPIPLLSPIDGEVIVATTQPGQTVTTAEAVVVLSNHLITRAQVDETDIGKIKLGQSAVITLDAYPDTKIKASVAHIYYESQTVNNVTIYNVDLLPDNVPAFFRSGMNATVDFIIQSKEDILLVPLDALRKEKDTSYVLLKQENGNQPVLAPVNLGISDDKNVEVVSGINKNDTIIITTKKYIPPSANIGSNPFATFGQRKNQAGAKTGKKQ